MYKLSHFRHVRLFATLWTVVCQAPLPMGFSRQEYWSGLPFPTPGDLPDQVINCVSYLLHWEVDSLPLAPPGKTCVRLNGLLIPNLSGLCGWSHRHPRRCLTVARLHTRWCGRWEETERLSCFRYDSRCHNHLGGAVWTTAAHHFYCSYS